MRQAAEPRCPGCGGVVKDRDWWDHTECMDEAHKVRKYDETDQDDYPETRERTS
ncbi:MAG: hypothetical protein HY829_10595 [Actinobacteria bacterium]|nr:hypothetical protein [Actinomycetota bacterium]